MDSPVEGKPQSCRLTKGFSRLIEHLRYPDLTQLEFCRMELDSTVKNVPDPMDVALGGAVRTRRRVIGISQSMLAENCNVSFQQIQKYELGVNRISFSRLVQIARALKCRVVDLIDVIDAPDDGITGHLDLVARMRTPGALELLSAYKRLTPSARSPLVALLGILVSRNTGHFGPTT